MNQKKTHYMQERYFNLYDNLSDDVLLYMCDNEFTIMPDSYVLFKHNKREIVYNKMRLARSDHYRREWLQLSLDLECCNNNNNKRTIR